jgi:DNA-binding MarR family transcriptional regulator
MSMPFLCETEADLARQLETALALLRDRAAKVDTPDMPVGIRQQQLDLGLTETAKALYRARRQREHYFGALAEAFSEPAWDLMLDLFIARREGRRVSVTSAAIAANVPSTTALRWIMLLEEQGVVSREPDARDRRRTWLCLEESAYRQMESYVGDCVLAGAAGRISAHCLSSVASA